MADGFDCSSGTCRVTTLPPAKVGFSPTPGNLMPIPKRRLGLIWGPPDAQICIATYLDPICPDCTDEWKTINAVLARYPTQVRFALYLLPLPYHTWAFRLGQGLIAVRSIDPEKAKGLLGRVLVDDQDKFSNSELINKTEAEVIEFIIDYAAGSTGIDRGLIAERFRSNEVLTDTRLEFKLAGKNGVSGTPTVFVNGALTCIDNSTTLEDWTRLIDSLL
jgi:protein-disulfide isomerase